MEELKSKVAAIEVCLTESRRLLNVYERSARTNIGKEVTGMREALLQGQQLVEQTTSEMGYFMRTIEDRPADQVDLKPQIAWLSGRITSLIADLGRAEEKAKDAMSQTMSYASSVNDVSQDIQVQQRDLTAAQEKGEQIAREAQRQLQDSERLVREKEAVLQQKKSEIDTKSSEAASLRAKLPGYKRELSETQDKLARKRREAKSTKKAAIGGFGIAALGVAAAPFTFGLSLIAAAPAAGIGIGMAIDYNDLKDSISSMQSTVSSTESQISLAESSVARLTREKQALETSISQLRSTIRAQNSAQTTQRSQINKAARVKSDVELLQGTASATKASVNDVAGQLLELKQALNECVAALDAGNTELRVKTSAFDKLRLRKSRQRVELKREKQVIGQAVEALSAVGTKIPGMLLPGKSVRFLECKVPTVVTTSVGARVPGVVPRKK